MFKKSDIKDIYNLTPMQAGILFHYMMENQSFAYFQQLVFPARGHIDTELFEKALNKVIDKYDVLRTVFLYKKVDKPVQVVLKQREAVLETRDISHLPGEEKKPRVKQLMQQDKEKGFDLEKDIPMRVTIVKTSGREFTIIWSHHHIIMDGWCIGLVISDFFRYYYAIKEGQAIPAETAPPYSRYLQWLNRQDKEKGIRFWQTYLQGYERKAGVPLKRTTRPGQGEYLLEEYHLLIDQTVTSAINRIAKENEVTLNIIFQVTWALVLQGYNNTRDVVFGAVVSGRPPDIDDIDQIVGLFINTVPVRANLDTGQPFAELIKAFQDKEVATKSNEYLTLADIQAQTPLHRDLLDHILVFENYPIQGNVNPSGSGSRTSADFNILGDLQYHEQSNYDFNIVISPGEKIDLRFSFNSLAYDRQDIIRSASHIEQVINRIIENPHMPVKDIEIITPGEKQQLLYEFNGKATKYPTGQTVHELFRSQAQKTPDQIAVSTPMDINEIYDQLAARTLEPAGMEKLGAGCFRENPYIYRSSITFPGGDENLILLKTHRHNSVIIDGNMETLLGLFTGQVNLETVYSYLKNLKESEGQQPEFFFYPMDRVDLLEISVQFNRSPREFSIDSFAGLAQVVQLLYNTFLLELVGVDRNETGLNKSFCKVQGDSPHIFFKKRPLVAAGMDKIRFEDLFSAAQPVNPVQVLLLGDTPGMPSTGLLYLASYLARQGIKAKCQFYDPSRDYASMKKNIEKLIQTLQPRVVAISMKWFPYIARVIDICAIIKDYAGKHALDITVVVGGNTASYYWQEIIKNDSIDILVRGDGEEPLLKICQGEETAKIPNCVYKKDGQIIENPVTYIQDETHTPGIYLSHLEEILLSTEATGMGTFFIYTHKGCAMNCLYCGGCSQAQQKTFNRKKVLRRGIGQVRKDIKAVHPYTSTLHFEFDIVDTKENLLDYCKKIWAGIDLSNHFCVFSTLKSPSEDLIRLLSRTFKYVYWDYDICTYSQRHRRQLYSLGLVKPQPSDAEILEFMEQCSRYENIEVRVNLINGLPYFTLEDIEPGEALLSKIIAYPSFGELHWARLHAQPGAPIVENPGKHHMHSYATGFADFLKFSRDNFHPEAAYAFVDDLVYPYIYFEDDRLNSKITNLYLETNRKVDQVITGRRKSLIISNKLTYRELDEAAAQLSEVLRAKGVEPGQIVGLMLERSLEIPVGILGIMKAGCAYMPIDPEFPGGRVEYMLNDSKAAALVTTPAQSETHLSYLSDTSDKSPIIQLENLANLGDRQNSDLPPTQPLDDSTTQPCYLIYTSGTTGKPKGVLLTHGNLVNYVHWFSKEAKLTAGDKTILTSSFAFDLGYTSLYTSILKGGQLHILPREMYLLAERLLDYIKQQGITYLKVTPSLFSTIANSPYFSAATCRSLRMAAIGGEAINVRAIEKAHSLCPHLRIMNHYGPTEATIGSVATFVDFDRFEEYKTHPVIGNPIYNTAAYILGREMNLLPIGAAGELCISGTCLARGYLNRPELTAEKFIELEVKVKAPFGQILNTPGEALPQYPNTPIPQ
jgi:amino acid adenylation domain-containing protein